MGVCNDYRVSTIIVLCKDCNQDVGLYPARHQCNTKKPYLPTLCSTTTNNEWQDVPELIKSTVTRQASDSSMESGKWNFFRSPVKQENPTYYDTSNLKSVKDVTNGKKLWKKIKENEKWNELVTEKKEETKPNKLWSRIIQATTIPDECGPESDDDDWEGETHVTRILRDYYEAMNKPLPSWFYDSPMERSNTSRNRRLWQQDTKRVSAREKEIQELKNATLSRTQSERIRPDDLLGSFTPRRTHTTRTPAKSYQSNIPMQSTNYF